MKMCDLCTLLFLVPNYVQLCRLLSDKRPATPGNEWYGAASVVVVLEGRRVGRKIGCKWHSSKLPPLDLTKLFYVCVHRHPHARKYKPQSERVSRLELLVSLLRSDERRVRLAWYRVILSSYISSTQDLIWVVKLGRHNCYIMVFGHQSSSLSISRLPHLHFNDQVQLAAISVCANLSRHHAARGPLKATACSRVCAQIAGEKVAGKW